MNAMNANARANEYVRDMAARGFVPVPETIAQLLDTPARACTAGDVTWSKTGGQCLNCGGVGPNCFSVKHAPQPKTVVPAK